MCLSPITLLNKSSPHKAVHSILVPCGKCVECLQNYQNSWFIRFYYEAISHSKAVFFTLTYRPETVPELVDKYGVVHHTVYKKHVQDWLKRVRHKIGNNFKYYITSEYGPKTFRPHYHGVFFGLNQEDITYALADWQEKFGFTQSRDINLLDKKDTSNTLRYIAKYCNKEDFEYTGALHKKVYPTFHLISKGLGVSWIDTYKDFILRRYRHSTDDWLDDVLTRSRVEINGYSYSLPRYYKTKLYGQKTLLSVRLADKLAARNDELFAQQLQELQAQNPNDSAFRILDNENRRVAAEKFEKYSHQQSNFYNKSKL